MHLIVAVLNLTTFMVEDAEKKKWGIAVICVIWKYVLLQVYIDQQIKK